jgi:hypothetical protein
MWSGDRYLSLSGRNNPTFLASKFCCAHAQAFMNGLGRHCMYHDMHKTCVAQVAFHKVTKATILHRYTPKCH